MRLELSSFGSGLREAIYTTAAQLALFASCQSPEAPMDRLACDVAEAASQLIPNKCCGRHKRAHHTTHPVSSFTPIHIAQLCFW